MGINSVNTNFGALAALQSLNRTNEHLNQIQKRVTTPRACEGTSPPSAR
jgi:flagellin-like hook-associated protein FlgL